MSAEHETAPGGVFRRPARLDDASDASGVSRANVADGMQRHVQMQAHAQMPAELPVPPNSTGVRAESNPADEVADAFSRRAFAQGPPSPRASRVGRSPCWRRGVSDADSEIVARKLWTYLAEPGDRIAGALIRQLGSAVALDLVEEVVAAFTRCDTGAERAVHLDRAFQCVVCPSPVPDVAELVPPGRSDEGAMGALEGNMPARAELLAAIERWAPRADPATLTRTVDTFARAAETLHVRFLVPGDPEWPVGVDDLGDHAPLGLWVRGDLSPIASTPATRQGAGLGIVGARAATAYGVEMSRALAYDMARQGAVIVSGGALGIDRAAHEAALAADQPTVALMAGGPDRLYPAANRALLERIVSCGAVVSELAPGVGPTKWRFLQRNRLVAAMSRATVVVEAGARSGALNTAHHALTLGRPLGAVPGPATSAASVGCHRLIRDGHAQLVTDAADVAELAGLHELFAAIRALGSEMRDLAPELRRVLDACPLRGCGSVDDIARRSGLSVRATSAALARLELDGHLARDHAGWRRRGR